MGRNPRLSETFPWNLSPAITLIIFISKYTAFDLKKKKKKERKNSYEWAYYDLRRANYYARLLFKHVWSRYISARYSLRYLLSALEIPLRESQYVYPHIHRYTLTHRQDTLTRWQLEMIRLGEAEYRNAERVYRAVLIKRWFFCPQNGALPDVRRNCSTVDGVVTAIKPISWKEIRSRWVEHQHLFIALVHSGWGAESACIHLEKAASLGGSLHSMLPCRDKPKRVRLFAKFQPGKIQNWVKESFSPKVENFGILFFDLTFCLLYYYSYLL